jgi:type II secretory pathway pseudopilin PulG
VIVILGAMAALIAQRITDTAGRRVRASAERTSETLSAMARRDAMLSQPLALTYDVARAQLKPQVLFRDAQRNTAAWKTDAMLPEADIEDAVIVSVQADGAELDATNLRVEFDQFQPRPALRIVLSDKAGGNLWSVDMPAASMQAVVVSGDIRQKADASKRIDLDDEGKERVAW